MALLGTMRKSLSKKIVYVEPEQMNEVLRASQNKIKYYIDYEYAKEKSSFKHTLNGATIYVCDKPLKLEATTCYQGQNTTFICFKDGREIIDEVQGARVYAAFSQYWKVPVMEAEEVSATPILGFNPDYNEIGRAHV